MGVQGLTTYMRENKSSLFKKLLFQASDKDPTNLVVDAWSLIFRILDSENVQWVYGGEYGELYGLITVVVKGWLAVGLQPHFVFDGPIDPSKFSTVVSRMEQRNIRGSELFFRTPPSARSHPRFLDKNRLLPPLSWEAVVEAIKALMREGLPVDLHFANGEGDPYAVELAGKLNGYIIAMDSDFVILNAEGYKGYIPLDDLLWGMPTSSDQREESSGVKHGIIPPTTDPSRISLTCSATSPEMLASHLQLPVSLLPLLGALVGNHDFSPSPSTRFGNKSPFFDKGVPSLQKIEQVSEVIRESMSNSPQYNKAPEGCDRVADLTRRAAHTLLSRTTQTLAPDEESTIVEEIVESTQLYVIHLREDGALRPPDPLCLLGDPGDVCLYGRDIGSIVRRGYLDGYRSGGINPQVLNPLHTGTMWVRPFLEDPQKATAHRIIGRPIREWIYAILEDGVGLPVRPGEEGSKAEGGLDGGGEGVNKEKVIVEYIRRGPRFGPEDLRVRALRELLEEGVLPNEPIQLAPEPTRLRLFLTAIDAEAAMDKLGDISPEQVIPTLAVRWVVSWLYVRAMEVEGSMDRFAEKWTRSEVKALLLAFIRPTAPHAPRFAPEIQERNIQLTAQILVSIQSIIFLAQSLLLDFNCYMPLNLIVNFSGRRFHQLLNDGDVELSSSKVLDPLMDVVTAGLRTEAFGDEAFNKRREGKWQQRDKGPPHLPPLGGNMGGRGRGGRGGGRGRGRGNRGGFSRGGMFNTPASV